MNECSLCECGYENICLKLVTTLDYVVKKTKTLLPCFANIDSMDVKCVFDLICCVGY